MAWTRSLSKRCYNSSRWLSSSSFLPKFGILFDIDGVLLRGETAIPCAKFAMKNLIDENNGNFIVPTVFCTNASGLPEVKANLLSKTLGVSIDPNQIIMAHTPLKMFKEFHNKWCLVSGGEHDGGCINVAKSLGFQNVVSIDDLSEAFPYLDWIDRKNWNKTGENDNSFPAIEAILLLGEPVRWETNLQLITDVLLTNGSPNHWPKHKPDSYTPHVPVLAVNMDLQWFAKAKIPRFGHGAFLVCLENIYKKVSGQKLIYTALVGKPSEITYRYSFQKLKDIADDMHVENLHTVYAIGDNPASDIYGANMFNQHIMSSEKKNVNGLSKCVSVLVCSGVYQSPNSDNTSSEGKIQSMAFLDHVHRDFPYNCEMTTPNYIVKDVEMAVEKIFEMENFLSN